MLWPNEEDKGMTYDCDVGEGKKLTGIKHKLFTQKKKLWLLISWKQTLTQVMFKFLDSSIFCCT